MKCQAKTEVYSRICSVDGCEGKHVSRGYCAKHLYRFKKYGDPLKIAKGRKPEPWNKGKTRKNSGDIDDLIKKAISTRANNYLRKCKDVYEYKKNHKATYEQMAVVFGLSTRQLCERYKTHAWFLKGGGANERPRKVQS